MQLATRRYRSTVTIAAYRATVSASESRSDLIGAKRLDIYCKLTTLQDPSAAEEAFGYTSEASEPLIALTYCTVMTGQCCVELSERLACSGMNDPGKLGALLGAGYWRHSPLPTSCLPSCLVAWSTAIHDSEPRIPWYSITEFSGQ